MFFLTVFGRHRERLETKLELERQVQDYPPLQRTILETVREHGTVDAALLLKATGANRNTLKDNLRRMVQRGVLEKIGERRGTRYRMSSGERVALVDSVVKS
jgi:predicted HTH transcriptional regulator